MPSSKVSSTERPAKSGKHVCSTFAISSDNAALDDQSSVAPGAKSMLIVGLIVVREAGACVRRSRFEFGGRGKRASHATFVPAGSQQKIKKSSKKKVKIKERRTKVRVHLHVSRYPIVFLD